MALGDRIKQTPKSSFSGAATATVATLATLDGKSRGQKGLLAPSVASVATVAVARSEKKYIATDTKPSATETPSCCFSCHHYDCRGSAWPGLCRYFVTIGQEAKGIDFNKVDPLRGCPKFAPATPGRKWPTNGKALPDPRFEAPTIWPRTPDQETTPRFSPKTGKTTRPRPEIHPAALSWLCSHRKDLKAAGFTAPELWRRNRSFGVAWFSTWSKPGLRVTIENGVIVFKYRRHDGQEIKQTARPMPQRKNESVTL